MTRTPDARLMSEAAATVALDSGADGTRRECGMDDVVECAALAVCRSVNTPPDICDGVACRPCREKANAVLAALADSGMVVVPKEPTQEMWHEGCTMRNAAWFPKMFNARMIFGKP